jgi:hypothetical protein
LKGTVPSDHAASTCFAFPSSAAILCFRNHFPGTKECARTLWVYLRTLWNYMLFAWEFARFFSFVSLQNLTFFRIVSAYVRKSNRKLIFTGELLNEARQRILNGESQRKVAAALGTKQSTLRK